MMNKLYTIGSCYGAGEYFRNCAGQIQRIYMGYDVNKLDDLGIDENTILMFGGGEDIPPSYYGEKPNTKVMYSVTPSQRDRLEKALFEMAIERGAKLLGICRGAQMITALSGGKLWQHVENHNSTHPMEYDLNLIPSSLKPLISDYTTSVHHQMCRVETIPMKVDLLAWSRETNKYWDEKMTVVSEDYKEPEIFYIPQINALCFQGHPEFEHINSDYAVFSRLS